MWATGSALFGDVEIGRDEATALDWHATHLEHRAVRLIEIERVGLADSVAVPIIRKCVVFEPSRRSGAAAATSRAGEAARHVNGPAQPRGIVLRQQPLHRHVADRARYLGDPAFGDMPMQRLLSKDYAARLRGTIDMTRASPAREVAAAAPDLREGSNTTHFSVIDRDGNAVANTYTLNLN